MSKEKSKADILAEKLDKILVEAGHEPAIPVERTGCFVTIYPKHKNKELYIDVKKENREQFISSFEKKDFKIDERFSKEELIKSVLPITLDFDTKEIGRMGNVTCAAIASQHGMIMQEDKFWESLGKNKYKYSLSATPNVLVVSVENKSKDEIDKFFSYLKYNEYQKGMLTSGSSLPRGPWYFINLDTKVFEKGIIGIGLCHTYYEHAVTPNEFIFINEKYKNSKKIDDSEIKQIFDKYMGKSVLVFS